MHEFVTKGRVYQKGYNMPLFYSNNNISNYDFVCEERFKLIFIEAGSGIFKINEKKNIAASPAIICLNELDSCEIEVDNELVIEGIWFHPKIINQSFEFATVRNMDNELSVTELQDLFWLAPFCHKSDNFNNLLNIGPENTNRIKCFFSMIGKELSTQPDSSWPCRSRTTLMELLFLVSKLNMNLDSADVSSVSATSDRETDEIILFLHSNYMRKITISELVENFHMNRTTLTKHFNEITGMTVMEYLTKIRMYLAAQFLKESLLPILEVAERVGFNDITNFGRSFKRYCGCPPAEYRKKNCHML